MSAWQISMHDLFGLSGSAKTSGETEQGALPMLSVWSVPVSAHRSARFGLVAARVYEQPPALSDELPLATAIAQVARLAQPPEGLAVLLGPSDYPTNDNELSAGQFIGLRGVALRPGVAADESAWEQLLQVGLPLWAFAPLVVGRGDPLLALMYGNFLAATAETALPHGWDEDRRGIRWDDGPEYEIFDRHGFVIASGSGAGNWQDRGDEGLVRVRWSATHNGEVHYAWSQPRLIAPAGGTGGAGGCS